MPTRVVERLARGGGPVRSPFVEVDRAAVLFADISGFTEITERFGRSGPGGNESLAELLNGAFRELTELVRIHGGEVARFAGDAVIAIWWCGAEEDELAVSLAARCALGARDLFQEMPGARRIPVGLHSGVGLGEVSTAVVGGFRDRWHVLVAGEPLREAAISASRAETGHVFVAPSAWTLLAPHATAEPAGDGNADLVSLTRALEAPTGRPRSLPESAEGLRGFVPPAALDRIDADQLDWVAEFRHVTILFANTDYLDLSTTDALEGFHARVHAAQEIVDRFGGVVNDVVADEKGVTLVAGWGLPLATHEDDAVRGLEAALALGSEWRGQGRCGIGVTTGRAFCWTRGSELRREYGLDGDVVNRAARLAQAATEGVVCDPETQRAAEDRMAFESLGELRLKGVREPLRAYRPTRRIEILRQVPVVAPSIVDRVAERAILDDRLDSLRAGRGGVVAVEGEPGIGKSLLLTHLLARAEQEGLRCLVGAGDAIERIVPYRVWSAMLATVLGVEPGSAASVRRLVERLSDAPDLSRRLSLLAAVIPGEWPEEASVAGVQGQARVHATAALVAQVLRWAVGSGPVVIALEDVHWMDSASWAVVLEVVRRLDPLLLVMVSRSTDRPANAYQRLLERDDARRVVLGPLDRSDTLALATRRLGVASVPDPVADWVCDKTGGNPLFAEEILNELLDSETLQVENGHCHLALHTRDLAAHEFPESVEAVIASRLDTLSSRETLLLKTASVIGAVFSIELLRSVYPVASDRPHLETHLEKLEGRDLVRRHAGVGPLAYAFRHALVRDAVYSRLAFAQRREIHRRVAEWTERWHARDLTGAYAMLAHHWDGAGDVRKACDYAEKAGEVALRAGAFAEAAAHFSRALEIGDGEDAERRVRWEGRLGVALYAVGDLVGAGTHIESSLASLGHPLPRRPLGWIAMLARELALQGVHRFVSELRRSDARLGDASRGAERLAEKHFFERRTLPMLATTLLAVNLGEKAGRTEHLARNYAMLGYVSGFLRLSGVSRRYYARARAVARDAGDVAGLVFCGYTECVYLTGFGRFEEAEKAVSGVVQPARDLGDRQEIEMVDASIGNVEFLRGDLVRAMDRFAAIGESAAARANPLHRAWGHYAVGRSQIALGRLAEAEGNLREALLLLREAPEPVSELICHGLLGEVHARLGNWGEAIECADEATRLVRASRPSVFTEIQGYVGLAEIRVRLWQREIASGGRGEPAAREDAREAWKSLRTYARFFPIGRPSLARLSGRIDWLRGRKTRAARAWRRALSLAESFGIPYEAALAELELARLDPEAAPRAERRFEALGCPLPIDLLEGRTRTGAGSIAGDATAE